MQFKGLLLVLLVLQLAPLQQGCHSGQSKRKKRSLNVSYEFADVRRYFAACLETTVGQSSVYDWQSNVDFTVLFSNWYLNTEEVICGTESGFDTSNCWLSEIEQYLNKDDLLPFVKTCIRHYFIDYSYDPPQPRYPGQVKRRVSDWVIQNPPDPSRINRAYSACVGQTVSTGSFSKLNFRKLLASISRHSVLRKCDSLFRSRPLDYQRKFLALTRPDKQLRTTIDKCNKRHFPAGNFWSAWSPWSACLRNGYQERNRRCFDGDFPKQQKKPSECPGKPKERQRCTTSTCSTEWGAWSRCSATCGTGKKTRIRNCEYEKSGKVFKRSETQWISCKLQSCVKYTWSKWSKFSKCRPKKGSCGAGTKKRARRCLFGKRQVKSKLCKPGYDTDSASCFVSCYLKNDWSSALRQTYVELLATSAV